MGDIAHAMTVPQQLRISYPDAEIHWLTRSEFVSFVSINKQINKVWGFDKKTGLSGLFHLYNELSNLGFSHIYDAHNNLRSNLFDLFRNSSYFIRRPKNRIKRHLLFHWKINLFDSTFKTRESFLSPLKEWNIPVDSSFSLRNSDLELPQVNFELPKKYWVFAPSAAWPNKRWPKKKWVELLKNWKGLPIILIGGESDKSYETLLQYSTNAFSLIGKLNFGELATLIANSEGLVAADTGALHFADLLGTPCVGLIGPTAFGYPSSPNSIVVEKDLACKPCSKDGRRSCRNKNHLECMVSITPEEVLTACKSLRAYPKI